MTESFSRRRRRRPPGFGRAMVAALVLCLAGTACGIGVDRSPRVIDKSQQRELGASRPADAAGLSSNGEQRVFFVTDVGKTGGSRLQQVSRQVGSTPEMVLAELLKGPNDQELNGKLRTAIPTGATVHGATRTGEVVTVDLDGTLAATGGDRQILAIAQIVYSLTAIDGVQRVSILVDGITREWPTEDGTPRSEPLTRFAYAELDPSTQPDLPPAPSPTSSSTIGAAAGTLSETPSATRPVSTTSGIVGAVDPTKN